MSGLKKSKPSTDCNKQNTKQNKTGCEETVRELMDPFLMMMSKPLKAKGHSNE